MKKIVSYGLLVLITSMVIGSIPNAAAQVNPIILLDIATKAQTQIQSQLTDDSPEEAHLLFTQGSADVDDLRLALENNEIELAKGYFLSAMKLFKQIFQIITDSSNVRVEVGFAVSQPAPIHNLERLANYVQVLKNAVQQHDTDTDFGEIDQLFATARQQINDGNYADAQQTIIQLKHLILEIEKTLREHSSQQASDRAKDYAEKYIAILDRLIAQAEKQDIPEEIIGKLKAARDRLEIAEDPTEVVKQVKRIISIKIQHNLTQGDRLESHVIQIEKQLERLIEIDGIKESDLQEIQVGIEEVKVLIQNGEFEQANELLIELHEIIKSLSNSSS